MDVHVSVYGEQRMSIKFKFFRRRSASGFSLDIDLKWDASHH